MIRFLVPRNDKKPVFVMLAKEASHPAIKQPNIIKRCDNRAQTTRVQQSAIEHFRKEMANEEFGI